MYRRCVNIVLLKQNYQTVLSTNEVAKKFIKDVAVRDHIKEAIFQMKRELDHIFGIGYRTKCLPMIKALQAGTIYIYIYIYIISFAYLTCTLRHPMTSFCS